MNAFCFAEASEETLRVSYHFNQYVHLIAREIFEFNFKLTAKI